MATAETALAVNTDELTGSYQIDPTHSRLAFVARHAMVTKVRGAFHDFDGSIAIDAERPARSGARIVIQAASVDTGNADRDAHLRTNDFFAMDDHPTIEFVSTDAVRLDDDRYRLAGDLTIRGLTRPVSVDFEFTGAVIDPWGNLRIGFEGRTTVNRKDWGVSWNAALDAGGVLVSDKVTLEFDVSAVKQNG